MGLPRLCILHEVSIERLMHWGIRSLKLITWDLAVLDLATHILLKHKLWFEQLWLPQLTVLAILKLITSVSHGGARASIVPVARC